MKKRVLLFLPLTVVLFIITAGCSQTEEVKKIEAPSAVQAPEPNVSAVQNSTPAEEPTPAINLSCTTNNNCSEGKVCIERSCGTLAELYKTEGCDQKCNFGSIVVTTSDGETYTITKGQGSYTAAGALQWKVESIPDYCRQENVAVPFEVKMVNYGNVLRQYYVRLHKGETSEVMEHPVVPNIHFTLTLKSLEEKCS